MPSGGHDTTLWYARPRPALAEHGNCTGRTAGLRCLPFVRETRVSSPDPPSGLSEPPPLAGPWSLRSDACGRAVSLDLVAVAVFTRGGWPTCCGQSMALYVQGERLGPGVAGGRPAAL
jgi:hypothetical protein